MRTIEKNKTKPSGFLRTVHLPERWRFSHDTRQSPGESLSLFFLFLSSLIISLLKSTIMFILIPYTGISKFRAESRKLHIYEGVSLRFSKAPSLPKAPSGRQTLLLVIWWLAAGGDGNG
jgi:hypothetical protein